MLICDHCSLAVFYDNLQAEKERFEKNRKNTIYIYIYI